MQHGAGLLARCETKKGKEEKHKGSDTDLKAFFFAWLIDGSCWTLDCSCIGYGLRLLYVIHHGAGSLAR